MKNSQCCGPANGNNNNKWKWVSFLSSIRVWVMNLSTCFRASEKLFSREIFFERHTVFKVCCNRNFIILASARNFLSPLYNGKQLDKVKLFPSTSWHVPGQQLLIHAGILTAMAQWSVPIICQWHNFPSPRWSIVNCCGFFAHRLHGTSQLSVVWECVRDTMWTPYNPPHVIKLQITKSFGWNSPCAYFCRRSNSFSICCSLWARLLSFSMVLVMWRMHGTTPPKNRDTCLAWKQSWL